MVLTFLCPGWESSPFKNVQSFCDIEHSFIPSHGLRLGPVAAEFRSIPTIKQQTKTLPLGGVILSVVPGVGIEPTQFCNYEILSLARLPISPPGHCAALITSHSQLVTSFEAWGGIVPRFLTHFVHKNRWTWLVPPIGGYSAIRFPTRAKQFARSQSFTLTA